MYVECKYYKHLWERKHFLIYTLYSTKCVYVIYFINSVKLSVCANWCLTKIGIMIRNEDHHQTIKTNNHIVGPRHFQSWDLLTAYESTRSLYASVISNITNHIFPQTRDLTPYPSKSSKSVSDSCTKMTYCSLFEAL